MSIPKPRRSRPPFFAAILTGRQLLTQRRSWGLAALLAIGLASVAVYQQQSAATGAADASAIGVVTIAQAQPLHVLTRPVSQAGPEFLSQRFTGIVTARRTTQLAAKALGRVDRLTVDIGDRVESGQTLVDLDRAQLQSERDAVAANLKAAQAHLAELQHGPRPQEVLQGVSRVRELRSESQLQQANLDRTESLRDSAAISAQELDESRFRADAVQAQLLSAENSLELLREGTRNEQLDAQQSVVAGLSAQLKSFDIQLEEKRIVAPYDGHIQARLVDEGQVVAAGQPLLEMVESDALEVHVGLPVDLTHQLADDAISITLHGQTLPAQLARISPTIQSNTRTREVVLTLDANSYQQLAIGSAVEVELKTRLRAQGYWIPTAALTSAARGLWAVFIAQPLATERRSPPAAATHQIERRQVELLRSQGEWSEVRGPVDANEQLVIAGVHRIIADQLVIADEESREWGVGNGE